MADLDLGPVTERRFKAAFRTRAIVGRNVAARLVGVDVKTLDGLPIRSVPRGKHHGYTERDLRAFLVEGAVQPCAAEKPKVRPQARPNLKVVSFSQRRTSARGR